MLSVSSQEKQHNGLFDCCYKRLLKEMAIKCACVSIYTLKLQKNIKRGID